LWPSWPSRPSPAPSPVHPASLSLPHANAVILTALRPRPPRGARTPATTDGWCSPGPRCSHDAPSPRAETVSLAQLSISLLFLFVFAAPPPLAAVERLRCSTGAQYPAAPAPPRASPHRAPASSRFRGGEEPNWLTTLLRHGRALLSSPPTPASPLVPFFLLLT
jgi:hypothetical protein